MFNLKEIIEILMINIDKSIDRKSNWIQSVSNYEKSMIICRKKGEDYSPQEISRFKNYVDEFV